MQINNFDCRLLSSAFIQLHAVLKMNVPFISQQDTSGIIIYIMNREQNRKLIPIFTYAIILSKCGWSCNHNRGLKLAVKLKLVSVNLISWFVLDVLPVNQIVIYVDVTINNCFASALNHCRSCVSFSIEIAAN